MDVCFSFRRMAMRKLIYPGDRYFETSDIHIGKSDSGAILFPLKESAENILAQLGISPSSAIQMLHSQIVLTRGLPLDLHLPRTKPTAVGGMSRAELDAEFIKGIESLKSGRTYTPDEVDAELAQEESRSRKGRRT